MRVTGPSLVSETLHVGAEDPVATSAPRMRNEETKASISGSLSARGAAALHDGRRPCGVGVQRELADHQDRRVLLLTRSLTMQDAKRPHLLGQPFRSAG